MTIGYKPTTNQPTETGGLDIYWIWVHWEHHEELNYFRTRDNYVHNVLLINGFKVLINELIAYLQQKIGTRTATRDDCTANSPV